MIKKYALSVVLVLCYYATFGQVTNEGVPVSWNLNLETNQAKVMSGFDLKSLKEEDKIRDKRLDKPFRFGYEHIASLGFEDGKWNTLQNGDKVWLLNIKSKGAKTLNFIFDEFLIPEGATLYFYNDNHTDLLGAYTASQNREDMQFGSWLVEGEDIWVEYYEPKHVEFKGQLHISKVVHGYRSVSEIKKLSKGLNDSEDCNQDVNCPVGNDFDDIKDDLKKSVAMTIVGASGFCTGTLINNVQDDGRQLFLTANHCLGGSVENWAFRFNWVSPVPACSTSTSSADGGFKQTLSGATLLANNPTSDFAILEIDSSFPNNWDLVWAGWDRTGEIPDFTVGIHHPSGDIMKISRDDDSPLKRQISISNFVSSVESWEVGAWELGVTEPGSSGSALFDQDGRIIGQLAGGSAGCDGTSNNGQPDYYGRFDVSWDSGATADTRLKDWLDPNNTGLEVMEQYPPRQQFQYDAVLIKEEITEPICGDEISPTFSIMNRGLQPITKATLIYQQDDGLENRLEWTGNLAPNETKILGTIPLDLRDGNAFEAFLNLDGVTDGNLNNNTIIKVFDNYQDKTYITETVEFTLKTDEYPSETSWEFLNQNGEVLQSSGTLSEETTYTETFEVEPNSCYKLVIYDNEGDGICCDFGRGSFSLETASGDLIAEGGEFRSFDVIDFKVNKMRTPLDFDIYPNPVDSFVTVEGTVEDEIRISIYDIRGRLIQSQTATESVDIDLSFLEKGMYFLQIKKGSESNTKKIIKN